MASPAFESMFHGLSIHLSTPVDYTHVNQMLSFVAFSWFFVTEHVQWTIKPKDNLTANFTILNQDQKSLQVIFHQPGIYTLTASKSFLFSYRDIDIKTCLSPVIKLMSSKNMYILRSSDVHLQMKVERCSFYSLQHRWSIHTKNGSSVNIKSWEAYNSSHVYLPARSLHVGSFIIKYTASYIETGQKENVFINLKVFSTKPKAIISGGNEMLTSFQDWICLLGNSSYDPDYTNKSLHFNWKCTLLINKMKFKKCLLKLPHQTNICFSPGSLQAKGNYIFSLRVSNNKYVSFPAYQKVKTQVGLVPKVAVFCISCSDSYFFCSARTLRFKSGCFGFGCYSKYSWQVIRNDSVVLELNKLTSPTGNSSKTLVLKQGFLEQKYSYEITLKIGQHVIGYSTLNISPLPLPSPMYCTLNSTNSLFVLSLFDIVNVNCELLNANEFLYLHITLSIPDFDDVYTIYYGPKMTVSFRLSTFTKEIEKLEIKIYLVDKYSSRKLKKGFRLLVSSKNFSKFSMDFLDLLETYISHCKKSADHSSILTDLICFCLKLNNSLPTDFSSHHIEQRSWNKTSKDILSKKAFDIEVIHKNATNQILSYMIDFLVVDQWSKLQQASFLMKLLSNNPKSFSIDDASISKVFTLFERLVKGYKNYSYIELKGSENIPYYLLKTSNNLWNILWKNYEKKNFKEIEEKLEKYLKYLEKITMDFLVATQQHKVSNEKTSIIKFENFFSTANKYEKIQKNLSYDEVEVYFNAQTTSLINDETHQGFFMFKKYLKKSSTYLFLLSPFLIDHLENKKNAQIANKIETTAFFKISLTNPDSIKHYEMILEALKQEKFMLKVEYSSFAIKLEFSGTNISVDLNITIDDWTHSKYIDSFQPIFIFRKLHSSQVEITFQNRDKNFTKASFEFFVFSCTPLHSNDETNKKETFVSNNITRQKVCKVVDATINSLKCECDNLVPVIAMKQSFYTMIHPIKAVIEKSGLFNLSIIAFLLVFFCGYIISWILFLNIQKQDLYICGRWNRVVYRVTFLTSRKRGSGTTSNVGVRLIGDQSKSENTHINVENAFKTNSCVSVLLACEKDLGTLKNIEVWHDNSGGSWTLSMVIVQKIDELEEEAVNKKNLFPYLETFFEKESMKKNFVKEKKDKDFEEKIFYFVVDTTLQNNNLFVKLQPVLTLSWWKKWCLEYRYQINEKHVWRSIIHSQYYSYTHPAYFNFLHSYTNFISFISIHSIFNNLFEKNYLFYSVITSLLMWLLLLVFWEVSFFVVEKTLRCDEKKIYRKLKDSIKSIIKKSKTEKNSAKKKKIIQLKSKNKKKSMSCLSILTLLEVVLQATSYVCINKWTLSIEKTTFVVLFNMTMLASMEYVKIILTCLFKVSVSSSSFPIHLLHQSLQQDEITLHYSTKVIKISPLKGYALEKSIKKSKKIKSTKRAFNNIILFSVFIFLFVPFIILETRDKHTKTMLRQSLNEILLFSDSKTIEKEGLWWWIYAVSKNINDKNIFTKVYKNCSDKNDRGSVQRKQNFNIFSYMENDLNYKTNKINKKKSKFEHKTIKMENNTQCSNVYVNSKNQSVPLYVFQDIVLTQTRSLLVSCIERMYQDQLCLTNPSWQEDVACCGLGWAGCGGVETFDEDELLVADPWCYVHHSPKQKGYQARIPSKDISSANQMLQHLQDNQWIDHRSRILKFEVQVYSLNADMFVEAKSNILMHATGGLTFESQIEASRVPGVYSFRSAINIFLCMLMCAVSFLILRNNSTNERLSCKIIFVLSLVLMLMQIIIVFFNYTTYYRIFESYPRSIDISKIVLFQKTSLYPVIGIGLALLVKVFEVLSKTRTFSKIPNKRLLLKLLPLFVISLTVVTVASSYMFLSYNMYRSDFKSEVNSIVSTLKMMLLTSHGILDPLKSYHSLSIVITNIYLKISFFILFSFAFSIVLHELVRRRNINLDNQEDTNILTLLKDGFNLLFLAKKQNNKELFRRVHFEDDVVNKDVKDNENLIETSKNETNYGYIENDETEDDITDVCETEDCDKGFDKHNSNDSKVMQLCSKQTGYDTICRNWLEKTTGFFNNHSEPKKKSFDEKNLFSEQDEIFNRMTKIENLSDTEEHDDSSNKSSERPFFEVFEGLEVLEHKIEEIFDT